MKSICFYLGVIVLFTIVLMPNCVNAQGVGINKDGSESDPSAILDVKSEDKGLLIPRVALKGLNDLRTIPKPAKSLLIYNTSTTNKLTEGFYYFNGVVWSPLVSTTSNARSATGDWSVLGNSGTTSGTNFIGTTDHQALDFKTNNRLAARLTTKGHLELFSFYHSTIIGKEAGANTNSLSLNNVFIGEDAGRHTTSAHDNTAVGTSSLYSNITGGSNTAIGAISLYSNTTGDHNTAIGREALHDNTTGSLNTAVGASTLVKNTTGSNNTAVGETALEMNTTGSSNTAIGQASLVENTTGTNNSALGHYALQKNTTGNDNTAIGQAALRNNTTGSYNTAVGEDALKKNTIGQSNIAIGNSTLLDNTSGNYNIAIGGSTGQFNTTGNFNTALGITAMVWNTTGSGNTAIGSAAGPGLSGAVFSNWTSLGHNSYVTGSNQIHLGNSSITEIKGQVNFTTYSDARVKDNVAEKVVGLDFINRLRPVTYNFNVDRQNKLLGIEDQLDYKEKYDLEKIEFSGFLAQEVADAAEAVGYNFSGIKSPKHDKELYGISYAEFTVPLVKAVQELSAENKALRAEIKALKNVKEEQVALKKELVAMKKMIANLNIK